VGGVLFQEAKRAKIGKEQKKFLFANFAPILLFLLPEKRT
jgi:hypothetical protein